MRYPFFACVVGSSKVVVRGLWFERLYTALMFDNERTCAILMLCPPRGVLMSLSIARLVSFLVFSSHIFHAHRLTSSMNPPNDRSLRKYNAAERAILDPSKEPYMAAPTAAARRVIAQRDIFPALWNYWSQQGVPFSPSEIQRREKVC